ncbi:MAG: DUF4276 family protein [Holophagales bacterium]|nr:DUF4276 family protein [Holophagales bacterium]MYF95099.1 DUF4276 family protein [Holophagales bacterium]
MEVARAPLRCPHRAEFVTDTVPSKRLWKALPRYRKVVDGPRVARRVGLAAIREECARFDQWITDLEDLGPS